MEMMSRRGYFLICALGSADMFPNISGLDAHTCTRSRKQKKVKQAKKDEENEP